MELAYRNLAQQVVHELGKHIMQGGYKAENSLGTEAELCEKFNVSRTAVREAVKMLTAKGLISSKPKKGIQVLDSKHWNLFDVDVLDWILIGKPDLYLLRHFLHLRLAIEPQAAYLAAQFAQQDDLNAIENALARMRNASNGFECTHEADIEFHQSVLSASNNPFFIQLKNFIATALKINIRFTSRKQSVTEEEYQAHVDIFEHIKNKESQLAFDASMATQKATLSIVNKQIEALTQ